MKLKVLLEKYLTAILSFFNLSACFCVIIWTLNDIHTTKLNDVVKESRDQLILKKLENFLNTQAQISGKLGKTDILSPLQTDLPQKLTEFPSMETGFSLQDDPLLCFLGIGLVVFIISFANFHKDRVNLGLSRARTDTERSRLQAEIQDLRLEKQAYIDAKIRQENEFTRIRDSYIETARNEESSLNSAVNNIDESLKKINSSLIKPDTIPIETQTEASFFDFFG